MATIRCRNCGRLLRYRTLRDLPHFPFCSERCRLVDLDRWFTEEYRISEPLTSPEGDAAVRSEEEKQEESGGKQQ